jgi:NarL family two-component system response regulator YdfI
MKPMPETNAIRVLITDDHLIVREGLQLILETSDEIEVVGEAEDGREALRLTEELQPDVVLMDLQMPGMDGLTAIEHLQREQPEVAIVILTTYNEDEMMLKMMLKGLQLGARGYLLKDTDRQTLLDTIRAAASGEALLKPEILQRVLTYREEPGAAAPGGSKDQSPLSPTERELEVLRAAAQGECNKEIAFRLGISERTVKAHLTSVYNKLGVDSRAAAIAVAAQKGWLTPP